MSEEFKVLSDIEHSLIRKNMYLGSCTEEPVSAIIDYKHQTINIVPGLIKIVEEVYQNSIDAYIRYGSVSKIDISVANTVDGCEITVKDDGPGIPVEQYEGSYKPELCWTKMRAGTSFSDGRVTIGANGLGVVLTNVFSKHFIGVTSDGKKKCTVECYDNLSSIDVKVTKSSTRGTTVSFVPDLPHFGVEEFSQAHITYLRDQISNLSIIFPAIQFTFNGEKFVFKNIKTIAKKFGTDAISAETDAFSFVIDTSGEDEEFRCLSYLNGICNRSGGSHVDFILDKIIGPLREQIKKKHKIEVLPAQIKQHLLVAVYLRGFPDPKFESQTKDRITNSRAEISKYFGDFDFDPIVKKILSTPTIIDPMISAILFRKELSEKMLLAKAEKTAQKIKVPNHIAAQGNRSSENTLFIFEGDSASSNFLNVRDRKTMGCYSLRGKIKNVRGEKPVDIMKSKEIFELLSIIGLKFGQSAKSLNYGTIVASPDMDLDGKNIFCLLLNLFSNWPELFAEKRIRLLLSPLYICERKKEEKYFYSKEEFEKFNSKGWEVNYIKGLGGLPIGAYKEMLFSPRMVVVNDSDGFDALEIAFGNSSEKRKSWMMDETETSTNPYDKTVKNIVDEDYKEYSLYTVHERAIPSAIDGFKPVQRFVMWDGMKRPDPYKTKVKLADCPVASYGYHHGEVSAIDAKIKMSAEWRNNVPVFTGYGSFGSRLVPKSASPRYIFSRLSESIKNIFIDTDIAPMHSDEEITIPAYLLPIVPWVLVNGSRGVAVGFASLILPRSLTDVKTAVLSYLRTRDAASVGNIKPTFPKFSGEVEWDGLNSRWVVRGLVEESRSSYKITELPYGVDRETYVTFLNKLEEESKISSYVDECSDKFGFTIKVTQAQKLDIKNPLIYFDLERYVTENFTLIDHEGNLRIFNSIGEIVAYFCEFRIGVFGEKIKREIDELSAEIKIAEHKIEFIRLVRSGKIDVARLDKKGVITAIKEMITKEEYAEEYVNIPLYRITTDSVAELETQITTKQSELEKLKKTTPEAKFLESLKRI